MEASLRVNYFNSIMANPMASNNTSLSRLNRYFDVQPPPLPPPHHRAAPGRSHSKDIRGNDCRGPSCGNKCSPRNVTVCGSSSNTNSREGHYGNSSSKPEGQNIPVSKNADSDGSYCTNSECCSGPPTSPTARGIDGAACKTSTWTYKHVSPKNGGVAVIEKGSRVRPDKQGRRPLTKLNWKTSPKSKGYSPSKDYLDLDTRSHCTSSSSDVSPRLAVKRVTLLASHQQYRDAASFIHRLPGVTVRSALSDLPMDTLVEAMPLSLPVIEAIYCTAGEVSAEVLHVERVVWQMVRFFAQQEECLTGDIRWEFCGPFVNLCRDVLRVVAKIHPSLRRTLLQRRRQLERAIEGMGHHGLVGTSDESLTTLHDALKLEFEKVVKSYTAALGTLQELSSGNKGHISKGPAPIQASHQRQLSIAPHDIQERLIKNKSLLNIVEPTLGNHSLDILLGILQRRIEHDKDALFQFTQLRKEAKDICADAVVAPILMRYAHGCDQVLEMLREAMEESGCDLLGDDEDGSDVSGYHSDSDSAIMMSGNSPYVTKHARFNFLTRSVRDRSRVGTRMTLPMPSSSLSSSAVSSSQASSGPSCSSSAVGSDTQSQRGSDGGTPHEAGCKGVSPAPTVSQLADDAASVLKAPSEAPSGVSTLADAEDVGSKAELEALRRELTQARQTIRLMHEREKEYKERLNERSSRISGEPPARIRVTSPVRPLPHQDACSKSSNSNLTEENARNNNGDDRGPMSENSTCAAGKNFLRRKEIPKREFGRSKSVVDLVEDSSTCSHVNKSWAQTYSREYPKGYVNKGPKARPQNQRKNQFGDSSSVVAVVGPRPKITYQSPTASPTKASEDTGSCCNNNTKRLAAGVGSCDSNRQMSAALEANLTGRLENLALGDKRPSALVRRYANLYAQTRVETLDALDQLTEMRNASELKSKLLFSVVVLAFRSATAASSALRQDVRKILQVAPSGGNPQSADNPGFPSSGISVFHKSKSALPDSHVALANSVKGLTTGADLSALEAAMATVITANVDTHDLTQNVEDVCQQIWATLYDYPGLKKCEGLLRYVKECVRVAWGLVNQSPPYSIEYETRTYSDELHVRFHTSDPDFDSVRTYLWPALREGVSGPCVQKGVVIT